MNVRRFAFWIVSAVLIAGCVPEKYQWSPDGHWMTVLTDKAMHVCDADGKLTNVNVPGANAVSWFPDSKRLLVSHSTDLTTWADLTPYLSAAQSNSVAAVAQRARDAALAYKWAGAANNWNNFQATFMQSETAAGRDTQIESDLAGAICIYMRDHDEQGKLKQTLPPDRWKELTAVNQTVGFVDVYAIDASGAKMTARLYWSVLQPAVDLRVSPTGTAAIFVLQKQHSEQSSTYEIWVGPTNGDKNPQAEVSASAAWNPDWSADGKYVVYAEASGEQPGDQWLGTLKRLQVAGDDGKLLAKPIGPYDLCGLIADEFTRVRCLKDGRIVFACVEENLPATAKDVPQYAQLFAIDPDKQATVSRLLPRQAVDEVGDCAQFFEVSPDLKYVSIPSRDGTVSVENLASGDVTQVQGAALPKPDQGDLALPSVPTWRNGDELTFVTPGDAKHGAVVLWSMSNNAGKTLGAAWPDGIVPAWASHPATPPSPPQSVH
jgi:hypothetical protein